MGMMKNCRQIKAGKVMVMLKVIVGEAVLGEAVLGEAVEVAAEVVVVVVVAVVAQVQASLENHRHPKAASPQKAPKARVPHQIVKEDGETVD